MIEIPVDAIDKVAALNRVILIFKCASLGNLNRRSLAFVDGWFGWIETLPRVVAKIRFVHFLRLHLLGDLLDADAFGLVHERYYLI